MDSVHDEREVQGDVGGRPRSVAGALLKENETALGARTAAVAWLLTAVYYFYQYTLRSAPAVMMPQLSDAFGLSVAGVASMAGLFYYGYSPFSLVAGAAMDRLGPRRVVPLGAATVGVGALLFASGNREAANVGRFLQGAGGVFALVGAAYIATTNFPAVARRHADRGDADVRDGRRLGGPVRGRAVDRVGCLLAGVLGRHGHPRPGDQRAVCSCCFRESPRTERRDDWLRGAAGALGQVFRNPQSILCGVIAGLLFIPTTIFDMIWGVRYLQDARGVDYASAVMRSATVPLGWIIGCPLLGWASDRMGRRKPVIVAGALVLLGLLRADAVRARGALPPYLPGLVAGMASGAAMLPYTVIKEANPPAVSGTATGVVNFLNFTFSALLGPVFGWILAAIGAAEPRRSSTIRRLPAADVRRRAGDRPDVLLKETGSAVRRPASRRGAHVMSTQPGTGKYEQLLERCRSLEPVPTAVAHPCEETALSGAVEAGAKGLIAPMLVGPAAKIREIAKAHGIDLGQLPIVDVPHSHAAAAKAVELVRQGRLKFS